MQKICSKEKTGQANYLIGYIKPEYISSCYTCGGCNTVCPVNTGTGGLHPMKLVHMANMGLIDELLSMPDIWYCLNCGRCSNLCPMMVQSSDLFQNLKAEAVSRKIVRPDMPEQHRKILKGFVSALWHAASILLDGKSVNVIEQWEELTKMPASSDDQPIKLPINTEENVLFLQMVKEYGINKTSLHSCFTCRECSGSCPICLDPEIFDPLRIVRSGNFALKEKLLTSPDIWLCIDCRSCTLTCSQGVKVSLLIRQLQYLAYTEGYVPKEFLRKWMQLKEEMYAQYIHQIDNLLC